MARHLTWRWVEDYIVVVHTSTNPPVPDWDQLMMEYATHRDRIEGILVHTEGGSPSAIQRKQTRDALLPRKRPPVHVSVLTTSVAARMAITAFNLFFDNRMRAYPPEDFDDAVNYIGLPSSMRANVRKTLKELITELQIRTPDSKMYY